MAATYVVREYKNPSSPEVQGKYYMANKSEGLIDIRTIAKYIAERSGVSVGHAQGLIEDLGEAIFYYATQGNTVDLGPLGYLTLRFKGSGTVTKEEYHTGLLERAYIGLRAKKTLKAEMKKIEFKPLKYASRSYLNSKNEEEDSPGV